MKVFESGSGKWVMLKDDEVRYTSNSDQATSFDLASLTYAKESLSDFTRYAATLHVVEDGSTVNPIHCLKVNSFIKHKQLQHQYYGDDYVD